MSEIITDDPVEEVAEDVGELEFVNRLAASQGVELSDLMPGVEPVVPAEEPPEEAPVEEPAEEPQEAEPDKEPFDPSRIDPAAQFKARWEKRKAAEAAAQQPPPQLPPPQQPPPPAAPDPQQPPPQINPFEDIGPAPDLTDKPREYVEWQTKKLEQLSMQNQLLVQDRLQQQQQVQMQQQQEAMRQQRDAWINDVAQAETEYTAANPNYPEVYKAVKDGLLEYYKENNISDEKANALVRSEIQGMARLAYDEGTHPAKMVESLHRRMFGGAKVAQPVVPKPRNSAGQFTVAREAKASGEGVDLSQDNATQPSVLTADQIRREGANQRQIEDALTKSGTRGVLEILRRAEMGS